MMNIRYMEDVTVGENWGEDTQNSALFDNVLQV